MRNYTLLTLLPFVWVAVACAARTPDRAPDLLRAQFDDDWKYWMTEYPELATAIGYPGQDARWTDYAQHAIDARAAYLKLSVARLAAIDRDSLEPGDQL